MLFIPLPIVVAILLVLLFAIILHRNEGPAQNRPFLALILLCALQALLSGLRWGYDVRAVMYVAPVTAAFVPPLAFAGVSNLVGHDPAHRLARLGWYLVPAVSMLLLMVFWRDAIDVALVVIYLGYMLAILRLMWPGTDALHLSPFDGAASTYLAILFAAGALGLFAVLDMVVFISFEQMNNDYAMTAIVVGNLTSLLVLSVAAAAASNSRMPAASSETVAPSTMVGDAETLTVLQRLMEERHLYRDAELNLDRLSRRAVIPVRDISGAINRVTGKNVSQYVNDFRVAEACDLLADTDRPVTQIFFDVGFQTKSNFNREFRRVTDMTPLQWRKKATSGTR
ncbi:AraC family transcriptional regulator [uncultured Roseobacter sp.]|uniref:helix-turn-helix domain-containing protein n=1 Tax=uncultured Roseobacter sp. TaxID=114847 RepID=UPI00260B166B|nr:AraC family transcriptional regulator [uncultured Roseobacter sp.]